MSDSEDSTSTGGGEQVIEDVSDESHDPTSNNDDNIMQDDEESEPEISSKPTRNTTTRTTRGSSRANYKESSSDEEENENQDTIEDDEEIISTTTTPVRSRRSRAEPKNYNVDDAFKQLESVVDDEEPEESDIPKRARRFRRNPSSSSASSSTTGTTTGRVVRRGANNKSAGIGAGDYEIPKRGLRERSKKVNYAENDEEEAMEDEEQTIQDTATQEEGSESQMVVDDEEEIVPVKSKRTVSRTVKRGGGGGNTTKTRARTARAKKPAQRKRVVDSDDDDEEDVDDNLTSSESSDDDTSEDNEEDHAENEIDEGPTIVLDEDKDDVIEAILACRERKQEEEGLDDDDENASDEQNGASSSDGKKSTSKGEVVIEYLCKYKKKSYLHCEWIPRSELDEDIQTRNKLNRFHKQYDVKYFEGLEEYFNPEFVEVERIIDRGIWDGSEVYLVKWKGLSYAEATWEFEEKIEDKDKIEQYKKFNKIPPANERRIPSRPAPNKFKKMEESPSFKDGNQLREYQLEGLNWLVFCWYQRRSSILADEMGLGKTVQTVATLEYLRAFENIRGPFLIVAPLSTVEHWRREFENWTDMNVIVFHGNVDARNMIKNHEFFYKDPKTGKHVHQKLYKFNTLITTYEIVMAESSFLSKIPWQYLVVDEGHRLKNHTSKLTQVLKTFSAGHKLLLTGTPIQNNLTELFSLLQFLDPDTFYDLDEFSEMYGDLQGEGGSERVEELHKLISPYILRRLKEDVEKSIPPKEEIVVEVVPTSIQKAYEQAIFKRNREFLMRGVSKAQNIPKLTNVLMELRKVCNHPFLVSGAEENITRGMSDTEINEALIKSCSKMILVDKLLKKLREGGHKVLIFSQMVLVLNILEDYLRYRGYTYVRLDGTIKGSIRQQAIDRFNDPNIDTFVFLVSTKAGGVGINLTSADTVIIYDSDWNPQNDLQAQARCHRIGQTKEVKVYRLLTKNTKEKEIFERASMKLGLDRAVLSSNNEFVQSSSKGSTQNKPALEKEELELLLRHGAYSAFKIDDTEEQKMLMDEDIDTIMARTATVVRYDQASQGGSENAGALSSFSKATFCFSEDMQWENLLPREKTATGLMKLLSEDSSLETDKQKEDYMNDVKALVDAKINEIEKFRYHPDDELATLLTQMMYARLLDAEHKEKAKEWLAILEQPRLRNGSSRDEATEVSDTEDTKESTKKKTGGWYKAERQRFQKTLLEIGWGKWARIRESKLHNHSIEDIHSLGECFISQLATLIEGEKEVEFLKMLIDSAAVPEETSENTDQSLKIDFKSKPIRAADHIKIHLPHDEDLSTASLEIIKVAQHEHSEDTKQARVSKKKKSKSQASSSKSSKSDKNMCVRFYELTEKDKEKRTCDLAAPGCSGEYFVRLNLATGSKTSPSFNVNGVHPVLEDKEWIEQAKRGGKTWVKKLKFNLCLTKILEAYNGKLTTDNIPKVNLKPPTDWWDKECDRDLMLGFEIHGYGRLEQIKEDTSLCFKQKHDDHVAKAKSRKEKKDADSWPSIAAINKRANKLMELLTKEKDISALSILKSGDDTDELHFEDEAEIAEPKSIVESWSKREKADIQRVLMNHGLCPNESTHEPNFAKIISLANLRKTESAVKSYVSHFIKSAKAITNASSGDDEDESDAESKKKSSSSNEKLTEIPPQTAKKVLTRIELMNGLYTHVYPHWDECKTKFSYLKSSGLPKWWKSGQHDKELVRGIKKHGFDFKKIFEDKNFKFGSKEPPRDGLVIGRIEEIVQLSRKIGVVGSPTKSKGWNFTPKKTHVTLKSPPLAEKKASSSSSSSGSKRKVKRQTTLDFKPAENPEDPIEETSDHDEEMKDEGTTTSSASTAHVKDATDHSSTTSSSTKEESSSSKETTKESSSSHKTTPTKESATSSSSSSQQETSNTALATEEEDVLKKKIPKKPAKQKEERSPSLKRKKDDFGSNSHSNAYGDSDEDYHTPRKGEYEPNDKKRKTSSPAPSEHDSRGKYYGSGSSSNHGRDSRDSRDYGRDSYGRDSRDHYNHSPSHHHRDRDDRRDRDSRRDSGSYRDSRDYRDSSHNSHRGSSSRDHR
ncbi:hypothetical protein C9374_010649 [Naegleria lovaniensis]|uniref:Uncharacterized protein n=1 Tax=Naegleria lovaniensis TaxID=51637 RepID=A0AA88KDD8_NAELO|nr:uncharacterized protein C9374_010649 [Naegleria lovaniensis]KAG2374630.1 hypothetical protein C9374_010649 [Naegleria lovaniensis]